MGPRICTQAAALSSRSRRLSPCALSPGLTPGHQSACAGWYYSAGDGGNVVALMLTTDYRHQDTQSGARRLDSAMVPTYNGPAICLCDCRDFTTRHGSERKWGAKLITC